MKISNTVKIMPASTVFLMRIADSDEREADDARRSGTSSWLGQAVRAAAAAASKQDLRCPLLQHCAVLVAKNLLRDGHK